MVKTCTSCHKELAATTENFYLEPRGKFGLFSKCKKCKSEYAKKYDQKNKIKLAQYHKKYNEENKIKIAQYNKKYRQENKIKKTKYDKKYRQENKIKENERGKKYDKKQIKNLGTRYLKSLLRHQGFSNNQITPEIIELKLIIIKTKRL
jgi:hypothetical protein